MKDWHVICSIVDHGQLEMDCVKSKGLRDIYYRDIETISSRDFKKRVIEFEGPVMVVFVAGWWSGSEFLRSMLLTLKEETGDGVLFLKSDLSQDSDLAVVYEIYSIPTFLFFNRGRIVDSLEGMASYEILKGKLSTLISQNKTND